MQAPELPFVPPRAYPRLKYATPVVIDFGGRSHTGTTDEVAVGGLGARCEALPPKDAEVGLLFNLPNGMAVWTNAVVRYVLPSRFGVQFLGLPQKAREALEDYTKSLMKYVRSGGRSARRLHVTLRSMASKDASEQLASTVILSRRGGRLICRARFKIGEELRLRWPEKQREAQVRVVFRRLHGTLTDLGFEILGEEDFWGRELAE